MLVKMAIVIFYTDKIRCLLSIKYNHFHQLTCSTCLYVYVHYVKYIRTQLSLQFLTVLFTLSIPKVIQNVIKLFCDLVLKRVILPKDLRRSLILLRAIPI